MLECWIARVLEWGVGFSVFGSRRGEALGGFGRWALGGVLECWSAGFLNAGMGSGVLGSRDDGGVGAGG